MSQLGTIGVKLDLLVRQGMTFGPYRVSVLDHLKQPIDLTGAVLTGQVRKLLPVMGPLQNPLQDQYVTDIDFMRAPASGLELHQYMFLLTSAKTDALLPGSTIKDRQGWYAYDVQIAFPDSTIRPHLYGVLKVYREVTRP